MISVAHSSWSTQIFSLYLRWEKRRIRLVWRLSKIILSENLYLSTGFFIANKGRPLPSGHRFGWNLVECQILYRYEDSRLQNHLIGPTIQDTAVSKYNYSITLYLYLSKNTIYRYTCNVKVMGCILDCRACETVL